MSLYNMLFGMNDQSDLLLATIGMKLNDVERLRDVSVSNCCNYIEVYTRTGGGNREDYPQKTMRNLTSWKNSVDDDFDSTYCTDTIEIPEQFKKDVSNLSNILEHGLSKEFAQHLAITVNREPTESDISQQAYDSESRKLKRTEHFMANGHTFVPVNDSAMKTALTLAEDNGGELRSCWGILPIDLTITTNEKKYGSYTRAKIGYPSKWTIDVDYWNHCKDEFGADFPLTMANIQKKVDSYVKRNSAA